MSPSGGRSANIRPFSPTAEIGVNNNRRAPASPILPVWQCAQDHSHTALRPQAIPVAKGAQHSGSRSFTSVQIKIQRQNLSIRTDFLIRDVAEKPPRW